MATILQRLAGIFAFDNTPDTEACKHCLSRMLVPPAEGLHCGALLPRVVTVEDARRKGGACGPEADLLRLERDPAHRGQARS